MAGELEALVRGLFASLDRRDFEGVLQTLDDEAQGVDEISRRWLRGREELAEYINQMAAAVQDIHSELSDVHEKAWGNTGLVTAWLEQDYTFEGKGQHVSAPTSVALHRVSDRWRIVLLVTVPLPEAQNI